MRSLLMWLLRPVIDEVDALLESYFAAFYEALNALPESVTKEARRAAQDARNTEARVRRLAASAGDVGDEPEEPTHGQQMRLLEEGGAPANGIGALPDDVLRAEARRVAQS